MVNTYTPPYYQTCCGDGEETLGPRHSVLLDAGRKALDRKTAATELVVHKFISEADFNHGLDMWLPRPGDVLGTRKVLRDSVFVKIGELLQMYVSRIPPLESKLSKLNPPHKRSFPSGN